MLSDGRARCGVRGRRFGDAAAGREFAVVSAERGGRHARTGRFAGRLPTRSCRWPGPILLGVDTARDRD